MHDFLVSALAVAIAEIGDKTQLLALLLAARYRRPWPIVAGILVATLLNHALAGWLGTLLAAWLSPEALRWSVALSFAAIGIWTLIPDKIDADEHQRDRGHGAWAAFLATCIAFFLAEIGDKTQIATVVLAAKATALAPVVLGTTLGMLLANVPVVLLGSRFAQKLPLKAARTAAAVLFLALAGWVAIRGVDTAGLTEARAAAHALPQLPCADGAGMLCAGRRPIAG
jgi:putative Ca2+/H+ antiporter (TMEM165/GDT1 family)